MSSANFPDRADAPPSGAFVSALLRGVTSSMVKPTNDGISFDLEDGSVARLLLTKESARDLALGIIQRLQGCPGVPTFSHSDSSSGSPSVEVSTPLECDQQ